MLDWFAIGRSTQRRLIRQPGVGSKLIIARSVREERRASQAFSQPSDEGAPVEYRQLGNSGVRVSAVGLGGNTFGNACDVPQTAAVIHRAIDLGINHVDTADVYSNGRSED